MSVAVLTGGLALLGGASRAAAATAMAAKPFPNGVRLLVAGTPGQRIDCWADTLAPVLGRLLPPGTRVAKENALGNDGVTGANQFAVRATPDGTTALLAPGAAATAWLVGDPRVHFDTASWVPVLAGVSPAVLAGRVPLSALRSRQTLRIAASSPTGPELPALLGLDLLGAHAAPVFGMATPQQGLAALTGGSVDLMLLHGEEVPERVRNLTAARAHPLFTFGRLDATGHWRRDPLVPRIPTFEEISLSLLGRQPEGLLASAWRAAAAATMLDFALVLPQLTPTDLIALWRNLGQQAADAATVRGLAAGTGLSSEAGPAANASTTAVAADATTLLALRSWLARRFGWHQT
ncbi:MAG: hypothetical protein ACREFP_22935 [Acetobacteraceae bacterium]